MASPISRRDLEPFFSSLSAYAPIRQKVKFALRLAKWEEKTPEEIEMLVALSQVSEEESLFLQSLKETLIRFDSEKINECVADLVFGGKKKEAKTPDQVAEPLPSPRKKKQPPPLPEFRKINPRDSEEQFEKILEPVKLALQSGKLSTQEEKFAKQLVSTKLLLDQCMPFREAFKRCLGETALKKLIPDSELLQLRLGNPSITRESLLDTFLDKMAPSEPMISTRGSIQEEEKITRTARPLLHQRSHSSLDLNDPLRPKELIDQEICRKMLEGAVVMKFVFVAAYKKNFPTKPELEVLELLFEFYFHMKYLDKRVQNSIDAIFHKHLTENQKLVSDVFAKLLSKQTISKLKEPPRRPSTAELPKALLLAPFKERESAAQFITSLARIKYVYKGTYTKLSSKERAWMEFFLEVSLLMDFMELDFETAVRYVLPQSAHLDERYLDSLVKEVTLQKKIETEETPVSETDLTEILSRVSYLQNPELFSFFIEYIEVRLPLISSINTVKLGRLFYRIKEEMEVSHLSLQNVLPKYFNLVSLRRLFGSDSDIENLEKLRIAFSSLIPTVYLKHPSLKSEEAFQTLCSRAYDHRGKVAEKLQIIDRAMRSGLRWDLAIQAYLNNESLCELFDHTNIRDNVAEAEKAFDVIMK